MAKKSDKGNLPTAVGAEKTPLLFRTDFEIVYGIISTHKKRAMCAVHNESLRMLWEVGAYVSDRLKKSRLGRRRGTYAGGLHPNQES